MSDVLLRYLADNTNYTDFIRGIEKLTSGQKEVLFTRLAYELKKGKISDEPVDTTSEIISIERPTIHRELEDKPRSVIECCLHCGSLSIKRKGYTKGGVQRYLCKDCGKSFSENYGLITHYTHLSEWQWQEAVRATIEGISLTVLAKNIQTSTSTAWLCRMKIFQTLKNIYNQPDVCDGLIESDAKYLRISFKGLKDKSYFIDVLRRLPRHHMSRSERIEYIGDDYEYLAKHRPSLLKEMIFSSNKKMTGQAMIGSNHQSVCVLTAVDRNNNIYMETATAGTANSSDVYKRLSKVISAESVLITDKHGSYRYLCREMAIEHIIVKGELHSSGAFSLSRINALHSGIKRFLGSNEYLPASKYIDLYLKMFWWLQKNKDISVSEQSDKLFKVITGYVDNTTRANMQRVTVDNLVQRELPFDTKNLY